MPLRFGLALWFLFHGIQSAFAAPGTVDILLFDATNGAPIPAVAIYVNGEPVGNTDAAGALSVTVEQGTHSLTWQSDEGSATNFWVVEGQHTELLATYSGDWNTVSVELEAPPKPVEQVEEVATQVLTNEIKGIVRREKDQAPVVGAQIFVRGQATEYYTDGDGRFSLNAPIGAVEISVIAQRFAAQTVTLNVSEGEQDLIQIELVPAGLALADFFVRAPKIEGGTAELLADRKNSSGVSDAIGAEQMSRSGDSTAAGALQRVTGVTLVDGKYIYVRGLGERYSASLLNGALLPSPEPERRVVPLDLFPAGMLEQIVVQKTYSPDMPGEFGGGVVQIQSRTLPSGPLLRFAVGGGLNGGSTFKTGPFGALGPWDFLGTDMGHRALPEAVKAASTDSPLEETDMFSSRGYTADELESLGEAMPNVWNLSERKIPMDGSFSGTFGNRVDIGGRRAGYVFGLTYSNKWDMDEFRRTYTVVGENEQLEEGHYYDFKTVSNGVQLGTLLGLGASPAAGHTIESQTLVLRSTDNEARMYEGFNRDVDGNIRVERLRWIERMLLFEQLRGEHKFGEDTAPQLNWSYSFAWAKRAEPDRRETRYDQENDNTWFLSDRPEGNQRFFSHLDDVGHNGILSLAIPIRQTTIKLGVNASTKSRTVDSRRFKFMHKGPNSRDENILSLDPESVFTAENIGPDGFQFEEITRQTDNYMAQHDVIGAYALNETKVSERFRFMTGVRLEQSTQTVSTFELFNPDQVPIDSNLSTLDILPGAVATLGLIGDMQLRLGYGRTLSRPDFREMSPATFNDVTGGRQTYGNPDLTRATIDNVDFRWEWFPNPGEVIAASAFYKHFTNPIETIVAVSAQHSITYENALSAKNLGIELELRKGLDLISPKLELFYVSANTALIRSRVELGENAGIQTSNERPLQAQSPYVFNTQFGYYDPDKGHNVTLLYNVFGPRIEEVGALGAPDVYLEPVHRLDAVVSVGLGKGWGVGVKGQNLLDYPIVRTQGDLETESIRTGWSVAARIGWRPLGWNS